MQKINPLLDQASKKLKKGSSASLTEVGQSKSSTSSSDTLVSTATTAEPNAGFADDAKLDHVDAINQIFAEFEFAYHNQFHKAFNDAESQIIAKKYWLSSLEQYSPPQIVQAAKQVIRTKDYLPSIAALVKACEQGFGLFGLLPAHQAYLEACMAPSPKREYQWSHEAVYFAGKSAGWFLLANAAESVSFPLFEYHYKLLCHRVISGEKLVLETPTPIADKIDRPLSKKETKARLARMREELKL